MMPHTPIYEIRVKGHFDQRRIIWFEHFTLTAHPNGETSLIGKISDQTRLYGAINRCRDLGLTLLCVSQSVAD